METKHSFIVDKVKLGKKGQITIPKKIRDEDRLMEDDEFLLSHTAGGEIVLKKTRIKAPEDRLLEIIKTIPKFDWRAAWREVKAERKREHR